MKYDIKAIPTTYAGVRFRSRLEARWAAFFDQMKITWEYEPFDLDEWAPDFLLRNLNGVSVLVEVKPIDISISGHYDVLKRHCAKAFRHATDHIVAICGTSPDLGYRVSIAEDPKKGIQRFHLARLGVVIERHRHDDGFVSVILNPSEASTAWRSAGNAVQWVAR